MFCLPMLAERAVPLLRAHLLPALAGLMCRAVRKPFFGLGLPFPGRTTVTGVLRCGVCSVASLCGVLVLPFRVFGRHLETEDWEDREDRGRPQKTLSWKP